MKTAFVAAVLGPLLLVFAPTTAVARPPTRAGYDQITLGMTQADVEAVLGPAEEVRRDGDSTFLVWGEVLRSVTVHISDGTVVAKWHLGLPRAVDARKVTRANLARIRIGMTRDQVEAILGPGDDSMVTRGALMLSWEVGLGSRNYRSINVGFLDGKVAKTYPSGALR